MASLVIVCPANPVDVNQVISSLVIDEENASLVVVPSFAEIKAMVKEMDGSSSLGPDCFIGDFSYYWKVVEVDVCHTVQSFFISVSIEIGLNSSNMVLLLKLPSTFVIG